MKLFTDLRVHNGRFGQHSHIIQLLLMTLLIFAVMASLNPDKFLRYYNFESITFMFPELGLLSIAMMIAMLTGGIDLSVIGIANLSGILSGVFFHALVQNSVADTSLLMVTIGVLLSIGVGALAGLLNGFLITQLGIIPILATLGTGQIFIGLCLVLTGGPAIVGYPDAWVFLGNGKLMGLAFPLCLFITIAVGLGFILSRTTVGTNLILIGSNPRAAVFSGLQKSRMIIYSYMMSGVLASVAGIVLSGRTNAAKSDYGTSYLLQAVLIAVLGGTNPAGGKGSVAGISIAVIALMLLSSGFQIMRFSNHLIDFIWGAFLLLVIVINAFRNKRS